MGGLKKTNKTKQPTHMPGVLRTQRQTRRYPKLSLREGCTLETSEKVKSGMGSMGWKEAWCVWEEWEPTVPPAELGKHEEEWETDWGLEEQMMEGWDTAEERGDRGRQSSCPNEWLRDCLKVALDLGGCGVPSPCCPADRQLSTNLWEPMASWGSMCRWRRDIILGAVGTKQHHYQQLPVVQTDGQRETDWKVSGKILRCWDAFLLKLPDLKLEILFQSIRRITFTNLAFILHTIITRRKSQHSCFICPYKEKHIKGETVTVLPLHTLNYNQPAYYESRGTLGVEKIQRKKETWHAEHEGEVRGCVFDEQSSFCISTVIISSSQVD